VNKLINKLVNTTLLFICYVYWRRLRMRSGSGSGSGSGSSCSRVVEEVNSKISISLSQLHHKRKTVTLHLVGEAFLL
jgi:hypothetical protein